VAKSADRQYSNLASILEYDFTNVEPAREIEIIKSGFAGSGAPRLLTTTGNNTKPPISYTNNTGFDAKLPEILLGAKQLIKIQGPLGDPDQIIQAACQFEEDGIELKSISWRDNNFKLPSDAEKSK
jgi:hypothetical protein